MKKILNKMTKSTIILIIGIIIGCSLGVYAAIKYSATDIGYKDKTVKEALDELYKGKEKNSTNIYGVARSVDSSNSSWIRIKDSEGLEANAQIGNDAVKNDFDNIYPWSEIKSYNYNTDTKKITAWYGESGFTFNPDGNIEVLTYIPEFYYKREQKDGHEYVYITRNKKTGFTKSDAFSIGRYTISEDATRVHSKSGVSPLVSTNITNFREYARKVDPDYIPNDEEHPSEFGQMDYHYFIIQLLYLVEYADYNSQAKLGLGNTNNSGAIASGGCNDLGMKSGTLNNDGKHSMIYRGIEDIYGNVWQWVDGINIQNYQAYINYNPKTYESDKFDGDYHKLGYVNSSVHDKYVMKIGYDESNPLITFSIADGGSSFTYITDKYYSSSGNKVAPVGGRYDNGLESGLWSWYAANSSSDTANHLSSRLIKIN